MVLEAEINGRAEAGVSFRCRRIFASSRRLAAILAGRNPEEDVK